MLAGGEGSLEGRPGRSRGKTKKRTQKGNMNLIQLPLTQWLYLLAVAGAAGEEWLSARPSKTPRTHSPPHEA